MKKIHLLFAAFVVVVFASCVNEEMNNGDNGKPLSKKELAFYLGGTQTRSVAAVGSIEEETGVKLSLGAHSGAEYFLEESVIDLNGRRLATRGTPIYNENLTSVKGYDSFDAVTYLRDGDAYTEGDATYSYTGRNATAQGADGPGAVYIHYYDNDIPWPEDANQELFFYLKMPTAYVNDWAKNFDYDSEDGKIEFDYDSPSKGSDQKDMLVASRALSKSEYKSKYSTTGAPVTMYHALTGVKFRTGANNDGETKTIITKVEFTGLKGTGRCTYDPTSTTDVVTWVPGTSAYTFTQTFDNPAYDTTLEDLSDNIDGSIDYNPADGSKVGNFGDSWYKGKTGIPNDTKKAANKNLNDTTGSLTFWFVPQILSADVKLKVTFCIKTKDTSGATGGGEITHTIDFGKVLENVEWKAGELRTYTLNPEEVDVEIYDTMDGWSKTDLHITNTGNVGEYVRMLVIGNWYGWESEESMEAGDEPSILVGYTTDGSDGTNVMVTPWFREDDVYGDYFDETFKKGVPANGNKWIRGSGAYYYPDVIGPGQGFDAETKPLFQSYVLPQTIVPKIYIPTNKSNVREEAVGVHLIMEVVIQAIGATDANGAPFADCWAAWTNAIYPDGSGTIEPKSSLSN